MEKRNNIFFRIQLILKIAIRAGVAAYRITNKNYLIDGDTININFTFDINVN